MKLDIPYGRGSVALEIPEGVTVKTLLPHEIGADRQADIVGEALLRPIGSKPLHEIVRKGERVAVITSDITRPVPSRILLPPVLAELARAGVEKKDVLIVFALGSHRAHTREEKIRLAGEEVFFNYECVDSDGEDFIRLGETRRGTPVEIFSRVVRADRRVCLGNIEYHYFAGYSGGAKAIMPGVSTTNAIQKNHSRMLEEGAETGNLHNNPVREDIEEAAAMVGIDFIVNVVLDEHKNIAAAFCGDSVKAHRAGCAYLDGLYKVRIEKPFDIVLAATGGFPKDINLYQAQKTLDNASHGVRDGGVIILFAQCPEGLGGDVFYRWLMEAKKPEDLLARIRVKFELGGHKAAAIAGVLNRASVFLVSDMEPSLGQKAFLEPFFDPREALSAAFYRLGGGRQDILYIPYGASTLPSL